MSISVNDYYDDEYGNRHFVDKLLGEGGQGAVYRTKDKNTALKFVFIDNNEDIIKRNKDFRNVILKPIPHGLHITMPKAILKNTAGYVMQLMADMQPFADLEKNTIDENSDNYKNSYWIKQFGEQYKELSENMYAYIVDGGLRRRLSALLKTTCILAELHTIGLVYCDINPNNEFLSTDKDYMSVWFIDADNINFQSKIRNPLYFPDYGAPEVVHGERNTIYSDCYSLAVLIFKTLTKTLPFNGRALSEESTDDDDWESDDAEDNVGSKAQLGLLPWLGDENDDTNAGETLIPYHDLFTQGLLNLVNITFSEQGRQEPKSRSHSMLWAYELAKAVDSNITCPTCGMDFYVSDTMKCPWCDCQNTAVFEIESYRVSGNKIASSLWKYAEGINENTGVKVPFRIVNGFSISHESKTAFEIITAKGKTTISNCSEVIFIADRKGNFKKINGAYEIGDKEFTLLCHQENKFDSLLKCRVRGNI